MIMTRYFLLLSAVDLEATSSPNLATANVLQMVTPLQPTWKPDMPISSADLLESVHRWSAPADETSMLLMSAWDLRPSTSTLDLTTRLHRIKSLSTTSLFPAIVHQKLL